MPGHPHIDRWSWLMHKVIADRIEHGDSQLLHIAAANLERWKRQNGSLSPAQTQWVDILAWPASRLVAMLRDAEDQEAIRLCSKSPFAGAIDQTLRLELLREARAA